MTSRILRAGYRLLAILLVPATIALAQAPTADDPPNKIGPVTINYIYAAQFGLGGYSLGGLGVTVLTLPLSYTWDVDNPIEEEGKTWTVKLLAPIKYGHYDFDDRDENGGRIDETKDTLGWLPGVEVGIPVLPG
jgi:hypothetical protein